MINRVLIRLKIVQIIYAYYQNGGKNLDTAEKELFFSMSKAYDLYNYLLLLMVEVTKYANKRLEAGKHKLAPTKEELCPNTKFVDNLFAAQLASNRQLRDFTESQKKTWENEADCIKALAEQIFESDIYKEYMADESTSYEEDREVWRKIYKNILSNNARLDEVLEDQSLYWNDDKEIVDTFVLKTIKRFDPKNGEKQELLPEFKDEEDKDFARRLFRRAILNADYYRHLIGQNSKNWDLSRVALMDVIIMQIALAEILTFPNIPVSVSLNEYVEIAKLYSTPKSGSYINGTLDGIVKQLVKENKLDKDVKDLKKADGKADKKADKKGTKKTAKKTVKKAEPEAAGQEAETEGQAAATPAPDTETAGQDKAPEGKTAEADGQEA
ncbi:MAG: transcription antitermination factor NusB [Bacteroidales bacterium]|nr:transcription antitermination factor NusB [Bacteroidales bacterium]